MWQSGGRLSGDAISVLRVSAAEPGLSNNDIALRVGITNENSMSQLLARLARRGLMENTRTRGRFNVWQLTATGKELESAIRLETPARVARARALIWTSVCQVPSTGCPRAGRASWSAKGTAAWRVRDVRSG